MKRTHGKCIIWIFVVSTIFYGFLYSAFLHPCYRHVFSRHHYWSFYCFIFLFCWWVIYFASKKLKIWSLRLFLDKHSLFREETQQETRQEKDLQKLEQAIVNKSSSTITVLSIFMAVVALFLALTLQFKFQDQYEKLLRTAILITALTAIILMVFAIDILDTVANFFRKGAKTSFGYQVYFYRHLGPPLPRGGISYAYYGYVSFTLFFILSVSFFCPLLAGLGLSLFTYLGYPILFGYKGEWKNNKVQEVEIDQEIKWPSILLGAFFLIVTVLIWQIG